MDIDSSLRRLCTLVLLTCAACGLSAPEDAAPDRTSSSAARRTAGAPETTVEVATPRKRKTVPLRLPDVPMPLDLPPVVARGPLLQRLPKSTLLAVRLPHVGALREALQRTPLHTWMTGPDAALQREGIEDACAEMFASLTKALPEFAATMEQAPALDGEAVLALVSFDITVMSRQASGNKALPFTGAFMVDAGESADQVDALLQRGFAVIDAKAEKKPNDVKQFQLVAADANGWLRRLQFEGTRIELTRAGSQFLAWIGPAGNTVAAVSPLAMRDLGDSFLASEIVRAAPDSSRDGALPIAEAYLNLEPIWNAVDLLASIDVKNVLAGSGVTAIRGVAAAVALGQNGFDEALFVLAPGGKDLLTRTLTHRPLDPAIGRFISPGSSTAAIGTFDVATLYDGVVKLLPDTDRRELQTELEQMKRGGVDLRQDLIENIGPTFGLVGTLDAWTALRDDDSTMSSADFTLLVQVADGTRLRALLDALIARAGIRDHVRSKDIHGFTVYALDPLPLPNSSGRATALIEPHWYVGDDALIVSLSRAGLARSLSAAWDEANRGPAALKAALEQGGDRAFSIVSIASEGKIAASTTIGRRTGLGLEWSTHEGPGLLTSQALVAGAAVTSSFAIPFLISARHEANEQAALRTLRAIALAEQEFRLRAHVDRDGDGQGEFGTLAELTGTATLRGSEAKLVTPLLPHDLTPGTDGILQHSGYAFRLDLSQRLTRPIDFDEREFIAYAWPLESGSTGRRVFSVDAALRIEASDNSAERQHYSGVERAPDSDAGKSASVGRPPAGGGGQRGYDGGLWTVIE